MNMSNDGGPAFPAGFDYPEGCYTTTTGMTLRQHYIGQALAGIMASGPTREPGWQSKVAWDALSVAKVAIELEQEETSENE